MKVTSEIITAPPVKMVDALYRVIVENVDYLTTQHVVAGIVEQAESLESFAGREELDSDSYQALTRQAHLLRAIAKAFDIEALLRKRQLSPTKLYQNWI
jgi:hypothetical protein